MARNNAGGTATAGSRGSRAPAGAKTRGGREGGSTRKRTGGRAPMTIGQFAEAIIRHYQEQEKPPKAHTLSVFRRVLAIVERDVGVKTAAELEDRDIVRRFDEGLPKGAPGAGPSTRRTMTATFYAFIRLGRKLGILHALPELPAIPDSRTFPRGERSSPPSEGDVRSLLRYLHKANTWEGRRLRALVYVVADAGIPLIEALRLNVADVNLASRMITIRFRGGKPRAVRISKGLASTLAAWIPTTECEFVFPGTQRLGPWAHTGNWDYSPLGALRSACHAVGIQPVNYQKLLRFHAEQSERSLPLEEKRPIKTPKADAATPHLAPSVVLSGPAKQPLVYRRKKPLLSAFTYKAVAVLLKAGPEGLSSGEIKPQYGSKGWRETLARLKKSDRDWDSAIVFPEKPYGRYRIAFIEVTANR
jgi:integrase